MPTADPPSKVSRALRLWMPLGFALLLILLGTLGWGSYASVRKIIEETVRVRHTVEVLSAIETAYGSLATAESEQRGYILTEKPQFYQAYEHSRLEAESQVDALASLVRDNPSQVRRVEQIREQVNLRVQRLDQVLKAAQRGGVAGALPYIDPGETIMRRIREIRDDMVNEENRLLAERKGKRDDAIQQATATFALTVTVTFGLLTALYSILARFLASQEASRRAAEAHQAELQLQIEEKERAERELQRSNRELQDFAFVASHDLQEPLRKIQAFGDRLKAKNQDKLDETSLDYLARMLNAAGRMQELINSLLDISRITTKAQPFVQVDLEETVSVVCEVLERRLTETEGEIDIRALPTIQADPVQMRQLFQNLIGNALKFKAEGRPPMITIRQVLSPRPDFVRVVVEDNGIGFDPKHSEKIFTVFQRLHGRGEYEGSGIGLAICRRIVDRHGGKISADSTPGEGARFTIDLPKKQPEPLP